MRDVYISLIFFAWSAVALCIWMKLGYETLLIAMSFNDPGAGGAGFLLGANWGVIFTGIFIMFRFFGREVAEEIEKARRVKE